MVQQWLPGPLLLLLPKGHAAQHRATGEGQKQAARQRESQPTAAHLPAEPCWGDTRGGHGLEGPCRETSLQCLPDPLSASAAAHPGTAITHSHSHTHSHKLNIHTHKPRCTFLHIFTCPHTRTYSHPFSHTQYTLIHKYALYPLKTLGTLTHTQTHTLLCLHLHTQHTHVYSGALTCMYIRSHAHMHAHTWPSHSKHTHRLIRTDSHTLTHTPWGRAGVGAPGHLLPLSMALPGPPRLPGRRPLNPELCR